MPSACLARISRDRKILDFLAWHVDPSFGYEHLHTIYGESVRSKLAIPVIAAACTRLVLQMRVDVVGLERQRQADGENNGYKGSA
jgi:hypothetical protein